MKRSRSIVLTSLMAGAGVSLSACDDATQWGDGQTRAQQAQAVAFRSLEECKTSGTPADQCQRAYDQAKADNDANAPKFAERQSCEQRYGVDQCVPRAQAGGGSVFVPLLAGFMLSRALNGGGGFGGGMFGAPVYHDRGGGFIGGGSYGGGYGGSYGRSYSGGSPRVGYGGGYQSPSVYAPSRVQSRSAVISRGGFGGGGGRGFSFGG